MRPTGGALPDTWKRGMFLVSPALPRPPLPVCHMLLGSDRRRLVDRVLRGDVAALSTPLLEAVLRLEVLTNGGALALAVANQD